MQPAKEIMGETLKNVNLLEPIVPVVSNVTVESNNVTSKIKDNLINQVTEMVRWRETMARFNNNGVIDYIEIGSGAVLSNLAKRSCPSFKRRPVNDKTSVESYLSYLDNEDFND